ncbi:MAG: alpha/beta hydrolase-fold protein [Acidobacteriota bacterium]|nr:alpha/beta hydrolase-fold protein [Acidobacteriota bacterium]
MPRVPQVLVPVLLALALAGCAGEPQSWAELKRRLPGMESEQRDAAIDRFIAARGGTPIVENQTRLVFFARDVNGKTPRVVGDFNAWAATPQGYDAAIGKMTRVDGTTWSYLEGTAYTNARAEYVFFFDEAAVADPLNPRAVQAYAGPRSEVRMPFWVANPEVDDEAPAPAGEVIADTIISRELLGPRRVWYYLPPGYQTTDTLYPVMYVLDGANYVEKMDVPRILDRLIAANTIPPLIAVFSEPGDRQEEYSRNPRWRAFITSELVPQVDKRFRTFPAPDHRIILGSSLAAYGAVDLAVEAPSVFGLCAAIAPPEQTASVIANQPRARGAAVSIRFFVLGGVYDAMVDGARRLRTTLDGVNAPVTYLEVAEGHNTNTFRNHLDDAISALLAQDQQELKR